MPKIIFWLFLCLISTLLNSGLIKSIVELSLHNAFSTHILLIPFLSSFLLFRDRSEIFRPNTVGLAGLPILLLGGLLASPWINSDLSLRMLGMITVWIGGFIFFFGIKNSSKAMFPLLLLLLMIPIPEFLLQHAVSALQKGSAKTVVILFKLTGTPFYQDGVTFVLPGINIEIATQCSGIRSSLALFISTLLAGHLLLTSTWRKWILALIAIPLAMFKNGIRIAVLSLLAIYVDKKWLTESDLHRDGGILFFILSLLILFPVLWILRKSEKNTKREPQIAEVKDPHYS